MTLTRSTAPTGECRHNFSKSAKWLPARNTSSRATPRNIDTDKYGTTIDVSELTLEQVDTQDQVILVKEKHATSPESVANFLYTWAGSEQAFAVKKDQEFSLKPLPEIRYKLLMVQPDKAVIINTQKPNDKIEIGVVPP